MGTVGSLAIVLTASATDFERTLGRSARAVKATEKEFERSAKRMEYIGRRWSLGITAPIVAGVTLITKAAVDWEDTFADVRRMFDGTEDQIVSLEKTLRKMSAQMPLTQKELAAVAATAGQLGINIEAAEEFTRTMAMLGTATRSLSADEAATSLAQIDNIMRSGQKSFSRYGSTVYELGKSSAANEKKIVEFALGIAGTARIAKMSEAQMLAVSAAFGDVAIEAQAGGTAVSKVLMGMTEAVANGGKDLANFAATAGMNVQTFAKLWQDDAGEAFTRFVEGLSKSGDRAFTILRNLGLSDQRLLKGFMAVAGAGKLRGFMDMAAGAWEENNSLIEAANIRYKTAASRLKMLRNRINNVAITLGGALSPILDSGIRLMERFTDGLQRLADWFEKLPAPVRIVTGNVLLLLAAIGPATIAFGLLNRTIAGSLGVIAAAQAFAGSAAFAFASWRMGAASLGESLVYLAGGPVKMIILGIGAAIAAAIFLAAHWDKVSAIATRVWSGISAVVMYSASLIVRGIGLVMSAVAWMAPGLTGAAQSVIGLADTLKSSASQAMNVAKTTSQVAVQANKTASAADNAAKSQEGLADALTAAQEAASGGVQSFDEVHQMQDKMGGLDLGSIADMPVADITIPEIETPTSTMAEGIAKMGEMVDNVSASAVTAWEKLSDAMGPVNTAIKWAKDNWPTIGPIAEGIASVLSLVLVPALIKTGIEAAIAGTKQVIAWTSAAFEAGVSAATQVAHFATLVAEWALLGLKAGIHAAEVVAAWVMQGLEAAASVALQIVHFTTLVAKWAWLAAQATIEAGKIAAAWVISMGPIAWVIASVVAVAAVVVMNWERIKEFTETVWGAVSKWLSETWDTIKGYASAAWDAISGDVTTVWNGIKSVTDTIWGGIDTLLSGIWNGLSSLAATVWNAIETAVTAVWNSVKNLTDTVWNGINTFVTGIWNGISNLATTVWDGIETAVTTVWNSLKSITDIVWGGINTFVTGIWNGLSSLATTIWNAIETAVSTVWNAIKNVTDTVWSGIDTFLTGIWNGLSNIVTSTWNTIETTITTVWNAVKNLTDTIWNGINTFITGIWNGMETAITVAWNAIKNITDTVWNGIDTLLTNVWNGLSSLATTIWSGIETAITAVWNTIKSLTDTIWNGIDTFLTGIWNGLSNIVTNSWNTIENAITNAWNVIKNITDTIWSGIDTFLSGIWNGLSNLVTTVWDSIENVITAVWNSIKNVTDTIWNGINTLLTGIWNGLSNLVTTVWNGIETAITNAWNAIKSITDTVWNGIDTFLSGLWNGLSKQVTDLWDGMKATIDSVWTSISNFTTETWDNIKVKIYDIAASVSDKVKNMITNIKNYFIDMKDSIVDFVTTAWDSIKSKIYNVAADAVDKVKNMATNVKNHILTMKDDALDYVTKMVDGIIKWFADLPKKAGETVKKWADGVVGSVKDMWMKIVGGSIVPDMVIGVIDWFTKMADDGISITDRMTSSIESAFSKAYDGILNGTMTFSEGIKSVIGGAADTLKDTLVNKLSHATTESLAAVGKWSWGIVQNASAATVAMIKQAYASLFAFFSWAGPAAPVLAGGVIGTAMLGIGSLASKVLGSFKNDIPGLATGGIVTSPTFAQLGEGGRREMVLPLERDNVIADSVGAAVYEAMTMAQRVNGAGSRQSDQREVVLRIDGATFARLVLPHIVREGQRQGVQIVAQGV